MPEASEYTFDLIRILLGKYSIYMYLEILIRVFVIMTYTIFIIHWLGKRAVGELGSSDVLIVIAMGSAVGDVMFYPSIPLLVSITVITLISGLQKWYVTLGIRNEKFRDLIHPEVMTLIEDGKPILESFEDDDIDKNEVFMLLREHGIRYLSEVEYAFFEQSGQISVFRYDDPPENKNSILPKDVEKIDLGNSSAV